MKPDLTSEEKRKLQHQVLRKQIYVALVADIDFNSARDQITQKLREAYNKADLAALTYCTYEYSLGRKGII